MTKYAKTQIIWAGVVFVLILIIGYLGIYALQKSMTIKMTYPIMPNVRCELEMKKSGATEFTPIFSNLSGQEYINPEWTLSETTNSLIYNTNNGGTLGGYFELRVKSYTTEKIFVEASGTGVSYNNIILNAYQDSAVVGVLEVATVSENINFTFTQVVSVLPNFTATQFDLTLNESTLIKRNNDYYTPIGVDAKFKLIKTAGADDEVSITSLKINDTTTTYGAWYNKTTDIMTIPSANVNGIIEFDSLASWDGDIASSFSGGDGTPASPYQIANGEELALLSAIVYILDDADGNGTVNEDDVYTTTNGTEYHVATCRTANYEMTNNIYLNDETFTYNTTTGSVDITDGVNTGTIGTGNNSTTMGNTTYSGVVENWTPIGNYKSKSNYAFQGSFDGKYFKVDGCYAYQTYHGAGLFGTIWSDTATYIKNLSLYNSCLFNQANWIGFLGLNYKNGFLYNCGCANSIISGLYAGSLVGENYNLGTISNSFAFNNYVFSRNHAGGITGVNNSSGVIKNCYTSDIVLSANKKGGIFGRAYPGENTFIYNNYTNNSVFCTEYDQYTYFRNCGTFTSPTSAVTNYVNNPTGYTMVAPYTTNLLTALRTWVDDPTNNPDGIYSDWTRDETGVINNGYPYLVEQ